MSTVSANLPSSIIKRSGDQAHFDAGKIHAAILRAGKATNAFDEDEAQLLTSQALKVLSHSEYV